MADLLRQIEDEHSKTDVPEFRPGDTVRVGVKITEGDGDDQRTRIQPFEGIVLGRSGSGLNETFTVRRVTHGVGVERTFPVHSPVVSEIEVVREGDAGRAKLYYLRDRVGRRARVREEIAGRRDKRKGQDAEASQDEVVAPAGVELEPAEDVESVEAEQ